MDENDTPQDGSPNPSRVQQTIGIWLAIDGENDYGINTEDDSSGAIDDYNAQYGPSHKAERLVPVTIGLHTDGTVTATVGNPQPIHAEESEAKTNELPQTGSSAL